MMPHLPYPRRSFTPDPPQAPATAEFAPAPPPARRSVDLQTQLEGILDAVWKAEADWRFNDRLDMALKQRHDSTAAR